MLDDVYYPLGDHLGTARDFAVYDAGLDDTTVAKHLTLDSLGRIVADSAPSLPLLYAFTGREWDADSQLYYYRARWYDAAIGQFISKDPIGFLAGDANTARYTGNSFVNATDPSGLQTLGGSVVAQIYNDAPSPLDDNFHAEFDKYHAEATTALIAAGYDRREVDIVLGGMKDQVTAEFNHKFNAGTPLVGAHVLSPTEQYVMQKWGRQFEIHHLLERERLYPGTSTLEPAQVIGLQEELAFITDKRWREEWYQMRMQGRSWVSVPELAFATLVLPAHGNPAPMNGEAMLQMAAGRVPGLPRSAKPLGPMNGRLNVTPEAYAGVRQASQYLREVGVPRHIRKQVLESFDRESMRVRVAGEAEYGIRYYDNVNAWPKGRYLFEQFPATRNSLALPPNWNQMIYFKQFQIRTGAVILEGPAARQGFYPGGQLQKYILNVDDLLEP